MHKFTTFVFILYFYSISAYMSLYVLNFEPTSWIKSIIVGYAIPLQVISLPMLSILKLVNGTHGSWQVAPNFFGVVIVTSFYSISAYGLYICFHLLKKS